MKTTLTLFLLLVPCVGGKAVAEDTTALDGEALSTPHEDARPLPQSTAAALKQAESAYEYGDMPLLVESARLVTDGTLNSTSDQMANALRFLGIGLFVTGRIEGAKAAFEKLLQLRPHTELNPATTRPEIVVFFFDLRRRRIRELREAQEASRPNVMWNFLPPLGQFRNGEDGKAWVLLGLEGVALVGTATSVAVLYAWRQGDGTFPGHTDSARTLQTVGIVSAVTLGLAYVYGVTDGLMSRSQRRTDEELLRAPSPMVSVSLVPHGAALNVIF